MLTYSDFLSPPVAAPPLIGVVVSILKDLLVFLPKVALCFSWVDLAGERMKESAGFENVPGGILPINVKGSPIRFCKTTLCCSIFEGKLRNASFCSG